ncbi:hypothetical protein RSAG8_05477, partial [Rhizoctonia solani AG-8 WAC10335]
MVSTLRYGVHLWELCRILLRLLARVAMSVLNFSMCWVVLHRSVSPDQANQPGRTMGYSR